MSKFLDAFTSAVKEARLNIFRVTEYKDGSFESVVYTPSCACLDCYSIAKAFTVTAVGMLYDDGLLKTEDKVYDLLGEELPTNALDDYAQLTLDQLMLHKIGLPAGYLDIDSVHMSHFGKDFLSTVFTSKPICVPGSKSEYTDAAYYVLARIVDKVAGCPMEQLLWERLFSPLDFREAAWSKCPMGHAMGATGLFVHTDDIVKLGAVYMNGGLWQEKRIISAEWASMVLERGYELKLCAGGLAYGKSGMLGQRLMFMPAEGRVVAWQGYDCEHNMSFLVDMVGRYKD